MWFSYSQCSPLLWNADFCFPKWPSIFLCDPLICNVVLCFPMWSSIFRGPHICNVVQLFSNAWFSVYCHERLFQENSYVCWMKNLLDQAGLWPHNKYLTVNFARVYPARLTSDYATNAQCQYSHLRPSLSMHQTVTFPGSFIHDYYHLPPRSESSLHTLLSFIK